MNLNRQVGRYLDSTRGGADNVSDSCKNGVLTVMFPEPEAVKPRRIEVKA